VLGELGLAELVGGGSTAVGAGPLGAIEFTAPEIIWGQDATRQTDVWSLGMTLHRVLTAEGALGDIPQDSILNACRHVLHNRPAVATSVDEPTRLLLERCFAPEATNRYPTALDFANAVDQTI